MFKYLSGSINYNLKSEIPKLLIHKVGIYYYPCICYLNNIISKYYDNMVLIVYLVILNNI